MHNIKPKIWVLADSRVGNVNQAIALAEKLGLGYQLKPIEYNFWGKLPNFLLALSPIHVKKQLLQSWEMEGFPDLIISAGRRTASLASYLKHKSAGKVKIIQIMHPNLPFKQFDLIILPHHDKVSREELCTNDKNILRITGALNNVQAKIQAGGIELRKNYPDLKQFISVIIGGNSKNYQFTDENAREFAAILSNLTKTQDEKHTLFISFSRRTPNSAKQIIKNKVPSSAIIYDPTEEEAKPNPYFGMLAQADYIISTADSISMCSEAASTGKPLYIFCPSNFKSPKHLAFTQNLLELGIAKILDKSVMQLENYNYSPLNEVEKIANIIITKNWIK
ncbi:MAG TPA: mitochondrial fission ELM1 family protein [Rickettsia endosymbiont of Sericostoma sp.]|uniref:mitochondrial fission ELM1 family protein n=1 Tax=unclassified Candidatus Tisiphia TaxID=2996318 RepID=UPI001D41D8A5|nr:mitochondrial fission ELM1 family protein [Rickettsia endosymbiont of Sericostoma sp. HW-2014]HJD64315.1 mitochondrial fission ELM1 family protein [Rickettsia endosymbiont of Sericostoma sp.]